MVWAIRILSEPDTPPAEEQLLHRRLAETVAWCAEKADTGDPLGSLRSLPDPARDVGLLHVTPAAVVAELVQRRAKRVASIMSFDTGLAGGKLLVYFPDIELFDGAAEQETGGYFDVHNTPPWDTWIALVEDSTARRMETRFLVAYVPSAFIAAVGRGIWANPEECLCWLKDGRTHPLPGI